MHLLPAHWSKKAVGKQRLLHIIYKPPSGKLGFGISKEKEENKMREQLKTMLASLENIEKEIDALMEAHEDTYSSMQTDINHIKLKEYYQDRASQEMMSATCHISEAKVFLEGMIRICEN